MTDLATTLRAANVTHLQISKRSDGRWQASFKNPDGSFRVEVDADPVAATLRSLGASEMTAGEDIFT